MSEEIHGILSYPCGNFVPNSKLSETLKKEHHIHLDRVLAPNNLD